jgi:hypothetical protein
MAQLICLCIYKVVVLEIVKIRVPTVREKSGRNDFFSRSGNFEIGQGNLKNKQKSGKSQGIL